jgi:hypothetical protein
MKNMRGMIMMAILVCCIDAQQAVKPKAKPRPECTSPDGGYSVNGIPYACKDGKWVQDEESLKALFLYEDRRVRLLHDMQRRVLTAKEEADADSMGDDLAQEQGPGMHRYDKALNQKIVNEAWLQQRRLQRLERESCDKP